MKSRLHPIVISILCCIAFVIFASHAISSQPVGKATQAVQTTKSGHGPVMTDDPVFVGDEFIVGTNGSLIILFADESVLTLKAGSKAKIQAFKMGKPGMALIKATAGKYRYTPGQILSQGGVQYVVNDNSPLTTDELAAANASGSTNTADSNAKADASGGELAAVSNGKESAAVSADSKMTAGSAGSELAAGSNNKELASGSTGNVLDTGSTSKELAASSNEGGSTTLESSTGQTGNSPEQVASSAPDQSTGVTQNNAHDNNSTESNASGTGSGGTSGATAQSATAANNSTVASNFNFAGGGDAMSGCVGNDCMGGRLGGPVLGGQGMEGDFMTANQALSSQEQSRLETLNQVLDTTSNQNLAAGITNIGSEIDNYGPGITFDANAIPGDLGNTPDVGYTPDGGNITAGFAGYVGMIDLMTKNVGSIMMNDVSGRTPSSVYQNQSLSSLQTTNLQQTFNTRDFSAQKSLSMQQLSFGNLGVQRLSGVHQTMSLSPQFQQDFQKATGTIPVNRPVFNVR